MSQGPKRGFHYGDSLAGRIMSYFKANPEEELTYPDVMHKFDVCARTAQSAVFNLKKGREIECTHVIRLPSKGRAG